MLKYLIKRGFWAKNADFNAKYFQRKLAFFRVTFRFVIRLVFDPGEIQRYG